MTTRPLDEKETAAWVRLAAVVELLAGVVDTQLRRDAGLTHFEYVVLAMLSGAQKLVSARPATWPPSGASCWDALTPEQLHEVAGIAQAILEKIDPDGTMTAFCRRPVAMAAVRTE